MMDKTKQKLLFGEGTVEDLERSVKMFQRLGEVFTNPIIGHVGWVDSITEEQKQRITIERMKQIKQSDGEKITEATDYEAMVYVMTASLSAPLNRIWFNIYAFLFRQFYPDKANEIFDKHEGQSLGLMEQQEVKRLKQWLWKTSRKKR